MLETSSQLPFYEPKSDFLDTYIDLYHKEGPYYTSYPNLKEWTQEFNHKTYVDALDEFYKTHDHDTPIHLYLHIPFCAKLCWYCICRIQVTNNEETIQHFLNYILREIQMLEEYFAEKKISPNFAEIHLGGGTPSHLSRPQVKQLVLALRSLVDFDKLHEFTMEIDPRTCNAEDVSYYLDLGIDRISTGVQDFNLEVQKAVNRVQPYELIKEVFCKENTSRMKGFNFDLLYGLPKQTRQTFVESLELAKEISPSRITLLKYAHVPEIRSHMKLIKDADLPPVEDLPYMFFDSIERLVDGGYRWVGIDNFALESDDLADAFKKKEVFRTFNGFTAGRTKHMLSIGPSSTAAFGPYYIQHEYDHNNYMKAIDEKKFPVFRGWTLSRDEELRKEIIFSILCNQRLDLGQIGEKYQIDVSAFLKEEFEALNKDIVPLGLAEFTSAGVFEVTEKGRYCLRRICKYFDMFNKDKQYEIHGC